MSVDESEIDSATWLRLTFAPGIAVGNILSVLPRVSLPVPAGGNRATVFTLSVSASVAW